MTENEPSPSWPGRGATVPKGEMANKKPEGKNSERHRKDKKREEKLHLKKARKQRDPAEPV